MARLDMVEAQLSAMTEQMEVNKKAATLLSDMINSGVVRQEDENTIVASNQDGEQRF